MTSSADRRYRRSLDVGYAANAGVDAVLEATVSMSGHHLDSHTSDEPFLENLGLYETAERVADALGCEAGLEVIADHPWVDVIERGRHRRAGDARPVFGPVDDA